jgi:hypothetical protein
MHDDIGELTDALLAIEWGPRFESFTAKEVAFLGRYNDFAWLLGNRSFFREPARLSITASTTLTHAGTESLELAAITLRQAWQKGDTPHEKMLTYLRGRATGEHRDETVELLDALDAHFDDRRGETLMSFVDGADLDAGRWPKTIQDITATEVLDCWVNGTSVHLSPKKAAAVAEWPAHQYEWSVVKAVTRIAKVVLATHVVVRGALGVLDEDRRVSTGVGVTATSIVPRRDS